MTTLDTFYYNTIHYDKCLYIDFVKLLLELTVMFNLKCLKLASSGLYNVQYPNKLLCVFGKCADAGCQQNKCAKEEQEVNPY